MIEQACSFGHSEHCPDTERPPPFAHAEPAVAVHDEPGQDWDSCPGDDEPIVLAPTAAANRIVALETTLAAALDLLDGAITIIAGEELADCEETIEARDGLEGMRRVLRGEAVSA